MRLAVASAMRFVADWLHALAKRIEHAVFLREHGAPSASRAGK